MIQDALKDDIRRLYVDEGLPASTVAEKVGVSRNSVVGLVHRNGWTAHRKETPRPIRQALPKPLPKAKAAPPKSEGTMDQAPRVERAKVVCKSVEPEGEQVPTFQSIADLEHWQCRWPVGTDGEGSHLFCGLRISGDETRLGHQPYCTVHSRKAGGGYRKEPA